LSNFGVNQSSILLFCGQEFRVQLFNPQLVNWVLLLQLGFDAEESLVNRRYPQGCLLLRLAPRPLGRQQ
jgi:hypothetical protein